MKSESMCVQKRGNRRRAEGGVGRAGGGGRAEGEGKGGGEYIRCHLGL